MNTLIDNNRDVLLLLARLLLAVLFLMAGYAKAVGYEGAAGYMSSVGVPAALLPLVIILEIGGAIALIVGVQARTAAILLAGFCVVSALIFHSDFSVQGEQTAFLKNLSLAGGLLALAVAGVGRFAIAKD